MADEEGDSEVLNVGTDDGHEMGEHTDWRVFIDDKSGETLNAKMVVAARRKEAETMRQMKVFEKVDRSTAMEAVARGAKLIDVRWLDTNRAGPGQPPDVRSRCVAKEFADKCKDELFAGTAALDSIRALI